MVTRLTLDAIRSSGASPDTAKSIWRALQEMRDATSPPDAWASLTNSVLDATVPYSVHELIFRSVYADWERSHGPPPAWRPTPGEVAHSNITAFCERTGRQSFEDLRAWSIQHRADFWAEVIDALGIRFHREPDVVLDDAGGPEAARWLPGARMNIADSCFAAPPERVAITAGADGVESRTVRYGELDRLSNRVANSLASLGLVPGDAVAIDMPMTVEAVGAYLGIVKAGCVVVSIADSFAPEEIATRLRIAGCRTVITQDVVLRGGKTLPMYEKVVGAGAERIVVVPATGAKRSLEESTLRSQDRWWGDFLVPGDAFEPVDCEGDSPANILFSSGTTGEPKAIPWTHVTPIKCAMDGYLHHDIHSDDVVAWPTNLGWMMGPWLIYASFLNDATMALYDGPPTSREFCRFVQDAGVTMLGLVPSIVRAWKASDAPRGLDWSHIKAFSSTGEPSNPADYLYLMSLAGYRPVIEYCGGTEIGGGYVTGTLVQDASPSMFTTHALGLDFRILRDDGHPADAGEVFVVPPSIGLSDRLLNKDHHRVYFDGVPAGPHGETLRRHGDQMQSLPRGCYRACGRADDTMNLGGIKVSSAEIEGAVATTAGVEETAAIAVAPPGGGPGQLVIYAVARAGARLDPVELREAMQRAVSSQLNPLFRVKDVVLIDSLPRTASNKVMRRVLREQYEDRDRAP